MAFDLTTARSCAKLCQLVYQGDSDQLSQTLENRHSKSIGDQFCVVGKFKNQDVSAVVVRGTDSFGGWVRDLEAQLIYSSFFSGRVHQGFFRSFMDLGSWLYSNLPVKSPVLVTGHSLGGAIATLVSQRLHDLRYHVLPVYTFGSPRVGGPGFAAAYSPEQWRVVNDMDPVAHVPAYPYAHVGEEYRLPEGRQPGTIWRTASALLAHLKQGPGQFAIDAISDHFMDSYLDALKEL